MVGHCGASGSCLAQTLQRALGLSEVDEGVRMMDWSQVFGGGKWGGMSCSKEPHTSALRGLLSVLGMFEFGGLTDHATATRSSSVSRAWIPPRICTVLSRVVR